MGVVRKQAEPSPCDCGECPQMCLKRQVGRGSAAMGWGAAGLTCRLCHTVPGCLQLALVTWWQSRRISLDANQYHSLPCKSSGPWPLRPRPHTGEGEGIGCSPHFGVLAPSPGPHRSLLRMGMGGQPQLHPEAGRQSLSSASSWMGTVSREKMVPSQRGVWRGDGFRQKEEVLVLTEKNLQIYHSQTSSPLSPSCHAPCFM